MIYTKMIKKYVRGGGGFKEIQIAAKYNKFLIIFPKIIKLCQKYKNESLICGIKIHKNESTINKFSHGRNISFGIDLENNNTSELSILIKKIFYIIKKYNCYIYLAKDSISKLSMLSLKQKNGLNKIIKLKKKYDKKFLFNNSLINRIYKY
jgi:hypothetical protein